MCVCVLRYIFGRALAKTFLDGQLTAAAGKYNAAILYYTAMIYSPAYVHKRAKGKGLFFVISHSLCHFPLHLLSSTI